MGENDQTSDGGRWCRQPLRQVGSRAEEASLAKGEGVGDSLPQGLGPWSQLPLAGVASTRVEESGLVARDTVPSLKLTDISLCPNLFKNFWLHHTRHVGS